MSSSPSGTDGKSPAGDPKDRVTFLRTSRRRFSEPEFSGSGGRLPGVVPEVGGGVFAGRQTDEPLDGFEADCAAGELQVHIVQKLYRANIETSGLTSPNEATGSYPTCVISVEVRLSRHLREGVDHLTKSG